ncbi:MAG: hypothetical protein KAQ64_03505 [Candidatus Pacebacteria bacterium]|nr:hypothetical protein [Candidatus Paceibacterota bacterium]
MRQILKKLNFSSKEIDIYLAALKLSSASVTELAERAGVKRPTTYVILEKFKEMGLISLARKKGIKIFVTEDPDKLLKLLEEEKEVLSNKEKELKNSLPKLKALKEKDTTVPIIRYYKGKEGIWNILNDIMNSQHDSRMITSGKAFDILGEKRIERDVLQKRRQIGTKSYIISDHDPHQIDTYRKKELLFREFRFLPDTIDLNSLVYIYEDKIALIFLRDSLTGIIIENKELFLVFKFMFDSLWKELKGKNLPEE